MEGCPCSSEIQKLRTKPVPPLELGADPCPGVTLMTSHRLSSLDCGPTLRNGVIYNLPVASFLKKEKATGNQFY